MKKILTYVVGGIFVLAIAAAYKASESSKAQPAEKDITTETNSASESSAKQESEKVITIADESNQKAAEKSQPKKESDIQPLFRKVNPDNILIMEFETGPVTFELAEFFAPNHVQRVKNLVREGFYDGLPLYRVMENFVVQGGDAEGKRNTQHRAPLQSEFTREIDANTPFTSVQSPDLLAEETGFINGFAIGRSNTENKEWLVHCPGTINLGRTSDPNSATTDFAIMFGQATRHLDRNMSAFGRIIDGWDNFYRVKRAPVETGGIFTNSQNATKVIKATIFADSEQSKTTEYLIENTAHAAFKKKIAERRKLSHEFFYHKGNGNLDICYLRPSLKIQPKQ